MASLDAPAPVPAPAAAQAPYPEEMFDKAAALFRIMSAPMRLRIINALCQGEKNVGELLAHIPTTQPNMSQHLNTLYKGGVLARRREGVQIFYSIANQDIAAICKAVCLSISTPRS